MAAQFLRCRGRSLWLQRCDFRTAEKSFLLTTAAQNMHVFLRKLPPSRKHFFVRLKTAISSNACGTSTLKSPLSRAFSVLHVHPRLRKRPPRCTLDCGFKTPESPALRGFVAGLRALATAALYLVLKSNGYKHPEIRLKKFEFSLKTTFTNITKKLSVYSRLKSIFFRIFNFAHKRFTFAFTSEIEYTLGSLRKIAHSGLHAETQGFILPLRRACCILQLAGCAAVICLI